jgi:hypothetical protein
VGPLEEAAFASGRGVKGREGGRRGNGEGGERNNGYKPSSLPERISYRERKERARIEGKPFLQTLNPTMT